MAMISKKRGSRGQVEKIIQQFFRRNTYRRHINLKRAAIACTSTCTFFAVSFKAIESSNMNLLI